MIECREKIHSLKQRLGYLFFTGMVITLVLIPLVIKYATGHEGHDTGEVGEYDLDMPRIVSPETARHIDLKTIEIGTGPIEEIVKLSGVVKAVPDLRHRVVSRVSGKVLTVSKLVGDPVKKGEILARIDSPEFARNLYEVRKLEVEYQRLLLNIEQSKSKEQQLSTEKDIAKSQIEFAKMNYTRAQSLVKEGLPEKELFQRKADLAEAEGNLKLKQIGMELARKESEMFKEQADALRLSREALLVLNNIDLSVEVGEQLTSTLVIKADADGVVVERWAMPG